MPRRNHPKHSAKPKRPREKGTGAGFDQLMAETTAKLMATTDAMLNQPLTYPIAAAAAQ